MTDDGGCNNPTPAEREAKLRAQLRAAETELDTLKRQGGAPAQKHPCTCPFSEKDPDAMCGPGCKCLACHPERTAVTHGESRKATQRMRLVDERDQDAFALLHRYIDQQEAVSRRLEIWADAANGLLGALANDDAEATRLAYGRVLKLVDGHWPEYSPPEVQVPTFEPDPEQGANPPAATAGSQGRDGATSPDAAAVSAAVDARWIRSLLATATRQANDGERAGAGIYQRHFTCLAIENVARAVTLIADRLLPITPATDLDRQLHSALDGLAKVVGSTPEGTLSAGSAGRIANAACVVYECWRRCVGTPL